MTRYRNVNGAKYDIVLKLYTPRSQNISMLYFKVKTYLNKYLDSID